MKDTPHVIVRARPEDAAELFAYLKIVGGETDISALERRAYSLIRKRNKPTCGRSPDR